MASLTTLVPCSHGSGCPLGVDVPAMVNALLAGDSLRAYLIARSANPLASSCGHGCHAPCETACRRRRRGAPVAIAALEAHASGFSTPAFLASPEASTSAHDARSVAGLLGVGVEEAMRLPRGEGRIAIVGAGAAGIGCAHDLALLGHRCVILDESTEPGGLLTSVIPHFRFPVAAARSECAAILSLPVEYRPATRIADGAALRALLADGFDAIFVAVGASSAGEPMFSGDATHPDVIDAMAVLRGERAAREVPTIVGDGDLALDAARVLLRQLRERTGVPSPVSLVLTKALEESTASAAQLGAALDEGVELHDGWQPVRVLVTDGGALAGLEIRHTASGGTKVLQCDQVVTAGSRVPATSFSDLLALDGAGRIAVEPDTLQSSQPRIWAGGACAFGHRSIAHAIADGKRAAWHIHGTLTGRRVAIDVSSAWVEDEAWEPTRTARALATNRGELPIGVVPPADPFSGALQRPDFDAQREASRCFDCPTLPAISEDCSRCGKCVGICPEHALSLAAAEGGPILQLDVDLCTRCGACVERCPEGAISMARAVWEERLVAR